MSATYDKLVDLLVDRFAVDRAEIRPDVTFEELEMDSLFLVELLLVMRSEFDVQISEDAASPTDTIEHAVGLIDDQAPATTS
ncbi:phosphopantetheine-binding protein [Streptomyces oceani]|uniref:Acyl carrier protein n=1 Tax=Streptomyces oceani TaxID=1075402 RepID=A0A1E7KEU8_9ACTN|nr:phosphopantetheine-binding protein [Streptomyces oceani]OEV02437.1 acyl carrier protein [Streptomyces oceani]